MIERVPAVPRNRTGKKLEVPVKRILLGAAPESVASTDVLADPRSLDTFVAYAATRDGGAKPGSAAQHGSTAKPGSAS